MSKLTNIINDVRYHNDSPEVHEASDDVKNHTHKTSGRPYFKNNPEAAKAAAAKGNAAKRRKRDEINLSNLQEDLKIAIKEMESDRKFFKEIKHKLGIKKTSEYEMADSIISDNIEKMKKIEKTLDIFADQFRKLENYVISIDNRLKKFGV